DVWDASQIFVRKPQRAAITVHLHKQLFAPSNLPSTDHDTGPKRLARQRDRDMLDCPAFLVTRLKLVRTDPLRPVTPSDLDLDVCVEFAQVNDATKLGVNATATDQHPFTGTSLSIVHEIGASRWGSGLVMI